MQVSYNKMKLVLVPKSLCYAINDLSRGTNRDLNKVRHRANLALYGFARLPLLMWKRAE